jgi:hypothetical protein
VSASPAETVCAEAPKAPLLFLLVDAIPYGLAHEAWASGDLPGFREPHPMVSVFPSLTEVAVPSLLREIFPERPPGYEARYYHAPSGEVHGPGDAESEAAVAPFRARPRGLATQAAIYLLRERLAYAQIRWITRRFRIEGGPWLGYVSATDGVAHFSGREGLALAFRDVAASVHEARLEHQRRTGLLPGVVLCSDHGIAFGDLEQLSAQALGERLECAGFRLGGRGAESALLVPYGDVGAGVVHVDPGRASQAADVVVRAPGVDLVFAREAEGFRVLGAAGASQARVRWRDGAYRYDAQVGDPLGYLPVWDVLERSGRLSDGWADDADLFAASCRHRYPDALARVRLALGDLVLYPAPVLFSMQDHYTYGPALTHMAGRLLGGLVGNHGALSATQSLGFAAVADEVADPWPSRTALRPEDVFRPWASLVRAGRATD